MSFNIETVWKFEIKELIRRDEVIFFKQTKKEIISKTNKLKLTLSLPFA